MIGLLGSLFMGIGGASTSWGMILLGRTFSGIGMMISMVCISVIVTKWFINDKLNLAYAFMAITWGPASFLASYLTPMLYGTIEDPHLGTAFFAAFWLNLGSIIFLIPVLVIDKMADNELKEIEEEKLDDIKQILINDSNDVTVDSIVKKKTPCFRCSDLKGFSNIFWWNNMSNCS